jgi:hypothetical protein
MKTAPALLASMAITLLGLAAALPAHAQASKEVRIKQAEILKHPIAEVALAFADLLNAGKLDEAMTKLASKKSLENWKKEPASEKADIAKYYLRQVPKREQYKSDIEKGGLLLVDGGLATLNVVKTTSKSTGPGALQGSSATSAIAFVQEGGQWKVRI